jgi:hypothetical protein
MKLSDEHIQSFIRCWTKAFGEVLTPDQARVEATRLVDFFGQFAEGLTRIRRRARTDADISPPMT